jgi:hypothetical protein
VLAALLVLVAVVVGCTGGDDGSASSTTSPAAASSTPAGVATPKAGAYSYANAGLNATVKFGAGAATLTIRNDTGRTLEKPGLYVEDATSGKELDGKVAAAAPIPDGKTSAFKVTFPPEVRPDTIGLLILLIGPDNYGAFVPPAAGG